MIKRDKKGQTITEKGQRRTGDEQKGQRITKKTRK